MRVLLAVVLPEPLQSTLRSLQAQHQLPPWTPAIPLHITLVEPFDTTSTIEDLSERLKRIPGHPFSIRLDGLGRFDNKESVIFAHVVPSSALTALAQSARTSLGELVGPPSRPYVPHMTLADSTTRENVDEYFQRLQDESLNYAFPCDRFALLRKDAAARSWGVIAEFLLV